MGMIFKKNKSDLRFSKQNNIIAASSVLSMIILIISINQAHHYISSNWKPIFNPIFLLIPSLFHFLFNYLQPWNSLGQSPKVYMALVLFSYPIILTPFVVSIDDNLNGFFLILINILGALYAIGLLKFLGFSIFLLSFYGYTALCYKVFGTKIQIDDLSLIPLGSVFVIIGSLVSENLIRIRKRVKESLENEKNLTDALEDARLGLEKMVEQKTKSLKGLIDNLGQGFFVIDKKGIIQEDATQITKDFFNIDPVGKSLSEVLRLDGEKKDVFEKWIRNIFRGILSFKDLRVLGPQSFESNGRYIDLDYKPIYVEGSKRKIDKVICVATDKTQEVELERKIELDKQKAEFITTCLQNPVEFVDLMDDTLELLEVYPTIKDMDEGELFRKFHTLKARYGRFGAKELTYYINKVETGISKGELDKLDSKVNKFDRKLKEFFKKNRLIIEAANKFMVNNGQAVQVSEMMEKIKKSETLDDLELDLYKNYLLSDIKEKFERYKPLIDELAEKQSKVIDTEFSGDEIKVDTNKYSNLINTSIHLFRNMVDHGIETEDERIEKTKPQRGQIKVDFKNNGDTFIIQMTDDGGGIDPEKIKDKVLEKGLKSEEDLQNLKDSDLVDMIFLPGFSTKEKVTDVSGRGVGMDAVREEVERLGGTISVSSKIDEGTKFTIELPVLS
tara:strand:+ start:811 stop:2829 length:2019 start_codon:yes stop_codon:yes gene_type:complete